MNEQEKDLLETFKELDRSNQITFLAMAHTARTAQENTKHAILAAVHMQEPKRSA